MSSTYNSIHRLVVASLAVGAFFSTTAFAQEVQPESPRIIRKSGGVLQGSATKRAEPTYPPLAKAARVSGSVVVEVTVDEAGDVISSRAISGHPLLKDAAVAASRRWKFEPTLLQGVAVKVIGTITFNFTLGGSQDLTKEIEDLRQQIAVNPYSAELYFKLGSAYRFSDETNLAIEAYNKALELKPDYSDAYSWLGSAYNNLGQFEKAIETFKRGLDMNPKNAEQFHMELARAYMRLNRFEQAVESARNALSLKHDFIYADEAHALIGLVLFNQARYSEALESFKESKKIRPGTAQVQLYLGMTYLMMGDRQSAMNEYQTLKANDARLAEQLLKRINEQQ